MQESNRGYYVADKVTNQTPVRPDMWWRNKSKIYHYKVEQWLAEAKRESKTVHQVRIMAKALYKASKETADEYAHEQLQWLDEALHRKKLGEIALTDKAVKVVKKFIS